MKKDNKNPIIHCALDLELEQPKTNPQTPDSLLDVEKIIQVGYVIYQVEPEFKVLESISRFVDIGVPLSEFIKKLTGIGDSDVKSGTDLETIYTELVKKQDEYKFSRVIKQWGGGDIDQIKKEIPDHLPWVFGRSGCNIKHMYQLYAEANGKSASGGLSRSLAKCGLVWMGRGKHNAEIDALNTAQFHAFFHRRMK